jgi:hypothetical protein
VVRAARQLALLVVLMGVPLHGGLAEYQFEDNVRDLLASAGQLVGQGELEESAIEYENVLAIDPLHREAALALFDVYLKLGAVQAADQLLPRLNSMGVDSTQQGALRSKLDGVKAKPPPPRRRVFTPGGVAPAPAAPGAPPPAGGVDVIDDDLLGPGDPAPTPAPGASAAPAAPGAPAPASPASPAADVALEL